LTEMWKQAKQYMFILADSKLIGDKHNLNKIIKKQLYIHLYSPKILAITTCNNISKHNKR